MSIYDFTVTNEQGESYPLSRYQGQPLIIVNTATKCGLSPSSKICRRCMIPIKTKA